MKKGIAIGSSVLMFTALMLLVGMITANAAVSQELVSDSRAIASVDLQSREVQSSEPLCRFGVNSSSVGVQTSHFEALRAGWYVNYRARQTFDNPNGAEYVPIVSFYQTGSESTDFEYYMGDTFERYDYPLQEPIITTVLANKGATWLIGNEPDRRVHQNDLEPHVYAAGYHFFYNLIKTTDPTAKIFAGGIVQPTPLRLQYLDLILASYQEQFGAPMPTDGWAIHNFILNEVSCDYDDTRCWGAGIPPGMDADFGDEIFDFQDTIDVETFKQRIVDFRVWMKNNGYVGQPLWVTEYGVLFPSSFEGFGAENVSAFMTATFHYMQSAVDPDLGDPTDGNLLVQRWSWYSIADTGFGGNLFDAQGITAVGQNYANFTQGLQNHIDLQFERFDVTPIWDATNTNPDLQINVQVANVGDGWQTSSATLDIYQGDPAEGGVLIATQALTFTPSDKTETFSMTLSDLPDGAYSFYAEMDVLPQESCLADNNSAIHTTTVFDRTDVIHLPVVLTD